MPRPTENILAYRSLHESELVRISEYRCRAHRGGPEAEEYSEVNNIVLMRTGAFSKHFGRRSVTADVNQAAFFTKGSTYRVSHPSDCGDRGVVFNLQTEALLDIIRELDPTVDEHPDQPFPFVTGPCDPARYWRLHAIAQGLAQELSGPIAGLSTDLAALELMADVVTDAFERHRGSVEKRSRMETEIDQADRVEAVKCLLASNLDEAITLDRIARAVGSSSFHLARLFQTKTGVPIHRYLTRLRLRTSLQRLVEGEETDDLTSLALELGFSSHSHFTSAFRREFSCTPSDVRRNSLRPLLQKSKNLTA
jgi:AraC family transcriptional regulator